MGRLVSIKSLTDYHTIHISFDKNSLSLFFTADNYTVKPAHVVTFIKQSTLPMWLPLLKEIC
jgi:hypothetical protein